MGERKRRPRRRDETGKELEARREPSRPAPGPRRDEDEPPDPGREDEGPARSPDDSPGRPSPDTDDPAGPGRDPGETPLVSAWAEEEKDPPSQRPRDTHEERPPRRKAS